MDCSTSSRSWISARRSLVAVGLAAALVCGVVSCQSTEPDTSPEGKAAIVAVQTYRTPLGNTVSDGVYEYIYRKKSENFMVEMGGWFAFKKAMTNDQWRVAYRFQMKGSDLQYRQIDKEARFQYDGRTGKVTADNDLAREMTKLP